MIDRSEHAWGIRLIMAITGGMVIPLSFFPGALKTAFQSLPTQFMFYQPLQIYLGRIDLSSAWLAAAGGFAWVVVLFICAQLMQRSGTRRLSISGG